MPAQLIDSPLARVKIKMARIVNRSLDISVISEAIALIAFHLLVTSILKPWDNILKSGLAGRSFEVTNTHLIYASAITCIVAIAIPTFFELWRERTRSLSKTAKRGLQISLIFALIWLASVGASDAGTDKSALLNWLGMLSLLASYFLYRHFRTSRISAENTDVNFDSPIGDESKDLLGWVRHARVLAEAIDSPERSSNHRIAIVGPWGTGKTSFMYLVRQQLERRNVQILSYRPWTYSEPAAAWKGFAKAFDEAIIKSNPRLVRVPLRFESLLRIVRHIKPTTEAAELLIKLIDRGVDDDKQRAKEVMQSALNHEFKGRHLVIMIDDLDRSSPEVIDGLLMIIKEIADFPQVTYVLAISEEHVKNALNHKYGTQSSENEFLQKIVNWKIALPEISTEIKQYFVDHEVRRHNIRNAEALVGISDDLPANPRKIKSLISFVASQSSYLERFTNQEIDFRAAYLSYFIRLEFAEELQNILSSGIDLANITQAASQLAQARQLDQTAKFASDVKVIRDRFPDTGRSFLAALNSLRNITGTNSLEMRKYLTDLPTHALLTDREIDRIYDSTRNLEEPINEISRMIGDIIRHLQFTNSALLQYVRVTSINLRKLKNEIYEQRKTGGLDLRSVELADSISAYGRLLRSNALWSTTGLALHPELLGELTSPLRIRRDTPEATSAELALEEDIARNLGEASRSQFERVIRGFGPWKGPTSTAGPNTLKLLDVLSRPYLEELADQLVTSLLMPGFTNPLLSNESYMEQELFVLFSNRSPLYSAATKQLLSKTIQDNQDNHALSDNLAVLRELALKTAIGISGINVTSPVEARNVMIENADVWSLIFAQARNSLVDSMLEKELDEKLKSLGLEDPAFASFLNSVLSG
ncbi:MAG: hypothetical protein EOP06_02490 [Proteobacteria bacterium]|nr:MAG: hypothetical protein EOP06_02490 [Pseudomonadota bacterium]